MKWLWNRKYALIALYSVSAFVVAYVLKLALDGAAYFLTVIPEFFNNLRTFLGWLTGLFSPLIFALIFAYIFDPVAEFFQNQYDSFLAERIKSLRPKWLKQHKKESKFKNRTAGAALTYLVVFAIITIFITWLARRFKFQDNYIEGLSRIADASRIRFSESYATFQVRLEELGLLSYVEEYLAQIINGIASLLENITRGILSSISSAGDKIIMVLMGLILAFYMLSGKARMIYAIKDFSKLFVSRPWMRRIGSVLTDVHHIFSGYIRGQLTDAGIMAALISLLLSIIGVDFAVIIGIFTGFSNMIPYFGAFLGFIAAVIVALLSGEPIKALYAAIGLIVLQQVDAMFINPKVVGSSVELSPMAVILALSVAGSLFGVLGMILAIPVCAIAKLFLLRYIEYRKERLLERNLSPTESFTETILKEPFTEEE
jgi:predicted PurR-regulated permease PerM